jgi:hypothetical protein
MHRAEDDRQAITHSPDFSDARAVANDRGTDEEWRPGAPGSGNRTDASRGLDTVEPATREPNPGHHTAKSDTTAPRGAGDGELMEQPRSADEARSRGPQEP